MATTTPPDRLGVLRCVAVACALTVSGGAGADTWKFDTSITATSLLSSNPGFQASGAAKADLVLSVVPRLILQGTGAGYKIQGNIGMEGVVYAARTQSYQIWPNINASGNIRFVDRWLYVDGGFDSTTMAADPLRSLADNYANRALYTRERFSPYLEHDLTPSTKILARSDNNFIQTRNSIAPGVAGNSYLQNNLLRYEMRPEPFGLRAEWAGSTSRFINTAGSEVKYDVARVVALYAVTPELIVGGIAGRDNGQTSTDSVHHTLKGGSLRWMPTERTTLDARVESRFFGYGWDVTLAHRSPFVSVSGELVKQATTQANQIAVLTAGASVASLLDAALITRIPNDQARAIAVQNLITQQGLPGTLANSAILYSNGAILQQRAALSVALLGIVHTVTLRIFDQTTQDLLNSTGSTLSTELGPQFSANAKQRGGSLSVTRRLSSQAAATVALSHTLIEGFGRNVNNSGTSTGLRATLTSNINPQTSVTGGVRVQRTRSAGLGTTATVTTAPLLSNADETAVFAGVTHRF